MDRDWLLLEVLGDEPVVIAQGTSLRKFVPIAVYLRRNPNLGTILATVDETVRHKRGATKNIPGTNMVVRTEAIIMNDGRVHGVHLWVGPATVRPGHRPSPGAVVWNLTTGTASDTPQALMNSGLDLNVEKTEGRPFAADLPIGDINRDESQVLMLSMRCKPGDVFASTWDVTAYDGKPIRVGFAARALMERASDGSDHLIGRAMNWRVSSPKAFAPDDDLAKQILRGLAQEGVHRALVDLRTWNLLKWLDAPFPHADWRGEVAGQPFVHPGDTAVLRSMTKQFGNNRPATGLLRLRADGGQWTLVHSTVHRIRLLDDSYAGLICIRLPTPAERLRHSQ